MSRALSIVCVTRADPAVLPLLRGMRALANELGAEFVVGLDHHDKMRLPEDAWPDSLLRVRAEGYQETVQDLVIGEASGAYVLRLDDDESCSPAMVKWLAVGKYLESDHWCFARAWLWGDGRHRLAGPPHWPDFQTRLSVAAKAQGHVGLHPTSPHGGGAEAPCAIFHHKLLLRSRAEREELCAHYDSIQAGTGLRAFYLPEEAEEKGMPLKVAKLEGVS